MSGGGPLARLPLLDAAECARALETVLAHREAWTARLPGAPFYTLGAASYLDAAAGAAPYYAVAAELNPLLERGFGWLYERLLPALASHLGADAAFEPRAARPGFHVFLAHPSFGRPLARIHFDLQYLNLEWDGGRDLSRPVSFTLPVRLPRAGAGLNTWNIAKPEYDAMTPGQRERIGDDHPPDRVPYEEGVLVCHSGTLLHQIAPASRPMDPDDMRVTLQGHALPGEGGYRVYW